MPVFSGSKQNWRSIGKVFADKMRVPVYAVASNQNRRITRFSLVLIHSSFSPGLAKPRRIGTRTADDLPGHGSRPSRIPEDHPIRTYSPSRLAVAVRGDIPWHQAASHACGSLARREDSDGARAASGPARGPDWASGGGGYIPQARAAQRRLPGVCRGDEGRSGTAEPIQGGSGRAPRRQVGRVEGAGAHNRYGTPARAVGTMDVSAGR